jgi:hypothetical protein
MNDEGFADVEAASPFYEWVSVKLPLPN